MNANIYKRIALGKLIGFIFGLSGFIFVPIFWSDTSMMSQWAMLFWYTTFGAIIGMFSLFAYHPLLKAPMPWWFLSPFLGAWLNFVLTLFIYDDMAEMMMQLVGSHAVFNSPFWFVFEGGVVGLLIGYVVNHFGDEGAMTRVR
jgi:hypothetical protein